LTLGSFISPESNEDERGRLFQALPLLTSHSETMSAAVKIFPDIARGKLSATKNFIGFCLSFMRKLGVRCARVNEERSFGQREIFLYDGQWV
jgi:hypothetical protein